MTETPDDESNGVRNASVSLKFSREGVSRKGFLLFDAAVLLERTAVAGRNAPVALAVRLFLIKAPVLGRRNFMTINGLALKTLKSKQFEMLLNFTTTCKII